MDLCLEHIWYNIQTFQYYRYFLPFSTKLEWDVHLCSKFISETSIQRNRTDGKNLTSNGT